MTLAINKMDETGPYKTVCHECLPKKTNKHELVY